MRKTAFKDVYQLKIQLEGIRPPIWRRIQVPETYTMEELHFAIQDAMGWCDEHMHEFIVGASSRGSGVRIGIAEAAEEWGDEIIDERKVRVSDVMKARGEKIMYVYDFGDNWVHKITLEKILPREEGVSYPVCVDGKRACPLEDCGGVSGYYTILEALKNPEAEKEYADLLEWVRTWCENYDPERFDPKEVVFRK
ncbi:MAG: plasmid pRiA4b ORF-3 family protein [Thermoplasmata archaeon]